MIVRTSRRRRRIAARGRFVASPTPGRASTGALLMLATATLGVAVTEAPAAAQTPGPTICSGWVLPDGHIITGESWTQACGGSSPWSANTFTIQSIDGLGSGATLTACYFRYRNGTPDRLPAGWVVVGAPWSVNCSGPVGVTNSWTVTNTNGLPFGTIVAICTDSPRPPGWEGVGNGWTAACGYRNDAVDGQTWTIRNTNNNPPLPPPPLPPPPPPPPPPPVDPNIGKPIGHLDVVDVSGGTARVLGWSVDPDTPTSPITVQVLNYDTVIGSGVADVDRPDVAAAHPTFGPRHGFDITVAVPTNAKLAICVTGVNVGAGVNATLPGCKVINYTPPKFPAKSL